MTFASLELGHFAFATDDCSGFYSHHPRGGRDWIQRYSQADPVNDGRVRRRP